MTGPLGIRLCWAGLLLVAALTVALRLAPVSTASSPGPVEPLQLPDVGGADAATVEYGDSGVLVSERNPFDPQGLRWTPKAAPAPQRAKASVAPAPGAPSGIKGVFQIPGVEGVFVADGFISLGETVQGARVQRVDPEAVVFSLDGKRTATWANTEREQRKKQFRELGLPLNGPLDGMR